MGTETKTSLRMLGMLAVTAILSGRVYAASDERPNILFILADDMGWADVSCYGVNRRFKTPNIDRLARQGTRFEQFYQAAPVCSPSRAGMISGRCPGELKVHWAFCAQNEKYGMDDFLDPKSTQLLPRLLKQAGYTTAHVGKWHLGNAGVLAAHPEIYGFDTARWPDYQSGGRNLGKLPERPDCSGILVDEMISVLDEVKGTPFYCQLWLLDPHAPLMPKKEWMAPFRKVEPEGCTSPYMVYAATMTEMDRQIGRLLDYLDDQGLAENTIVVFSSDNGPEDEHAGDARWSAYGSAGPHRGRKRSLYEGGTRVPFIVRWPKGGVPAGGVNKKSVISGLDLLPTLCDLTGAKISAADRRLLRGESVAAAWKGDLKFERQTPLYWERRTTVLGEQNCSPRVAVRDGKWKLLFNPEDDRAELYDMQADCREENSLVASFPEVVERLRKEALVWLKLLPEGPVDSRAGRRYGDY